MTGTFPAMSDIADRYRTAAAQFTQKVETVPDDRWESPTPCEDWDVRDVVSHVVDSSGLFLGFIQRELPPGPDAQQDPQGAWANARDAIQAALDDPDTAQTEYQGAMGPSTFEDGVDRFLRADLYVHGWDVARGAGLDDRIDPDAAHELYEAMQQMASAPGVAEMMRSAGGFGPEVEVPDDADEQTKLLGFLGRKP
jgi:uncharacterized protein (TIGR03086 family)